MRAKRSYDLNRLLDEPGGSPLGCIENMSLGRSLAGRCAKLAGVWTRVQCLPLRQMMPHLGGDGKEPRMDRRLQASRLLSLRALNSRDSPGIVRLPDQQVAPATKGAGSDSGKDDGRRVLTMPRPPHSRCTRWAPVP